MFAATKFQAPRSRAEHVRRTRCLDVATGPLAARHLLISAPAGAGKSTLAAQWAATFQHAAWISLSQEDDEPGQFWTAFIGSVDTAVPGFGATEVAPLLSGGDVRATLVRLVDELASLDHELAVVFDDLHLIDDAECHAGLAWLLDCSPAALHIALCSRTDPPFELDRLVMHGDLALIRGQDLLFDPDEAEEFLDDRLGLGLDHAAVEALVEQTEGWAAGLYLAALTIRTAGMTAAQPLAGHRRMRDYLSVEVIGAADPERRRFMEGVSVLERFSGDLCDHVLERTGSAALLEDLERSNMFVIPLDATGTWFRLHHLFAEIMAELLAARDPAAPARLLARAAEWHLEHDNVPEAIVALIRAGQTEGAAELIAAHHAPYLNQSRLGATVARWIDMLPPDLVSSSAPLCIDRAWVAGLNGRQDEMERWLERAVSLPYEGPMPDGCASPAAEAATIRACFGYRDFGSRLAEARRATRLDRPESPWWALSHSVVGFWGYLTDGPTDEVIEALAVAGEYATAPEMAATAAFAPGLEAAARADLGQHAEAETAIRRAAESRRRFGVERVPQASISWWSTSRALQTLGRLDDAARDAEAGVAASREVPAERDPVGWAAACLIQLGRVRVAQGDLEAAREALADARARLRVIDDAGRLAQWLEEAERAARPATPAADGIGDLSERELAVLALMAEPLTLREIGSELFVSLNTVKSHAKSIYFKLGVASRDEAVARGRELGAIP